MFSSFAEQSTSVNLKKSFRNRENKGKIKTHRDNHTLKHIHEHMTNVKKVLLTQYLRRKSNTLASLSIKWFEQNRICVFHWPNELSLTMTMTFRDLYIAVYDSPRSIHSKLCCAKCLPIPEMSVNDTNNPQ